MIYTDKRCQRVMDKFPAEVVTEVAAAVIRLAQGHKLAMPLSRPMPSVASGAHELRVRDKSGVYRVIYVLVHGGNTWLVHAFKKTTEQTSPRDIKLAQARIKEIAG